jgi:hypothetical protein
MALIIRIVIALIVPGGIAFEMGRGKHASFRIALVALLIFFSFPS